MIIISCRSRALAGANAILTFSIILGIIVFGGCSGREEHASNVLLITIDTLRPDRLGCYGYERALTPNIDRLASQGVLFSGVYAPVPRTSQSVASILTGLPPSGHGVRGHGEILEESVVTFPEIFRDAGYGVAASVTNYILLDRVSSRTSTGTARARGGARRG